MSVIAWRKLAIAGVTGFVCGKGYIWLKKYPDTVRPILYCSAISGSAGVMIGLGVAAYRDLPSHVYALSLGANFAVASMAFLGIRHIVITSLVNRATVSTLDQSQDLKFTVFPYSTTQAEYLSSATSGGLAGALATWLSRYGLKSVVRSGCLCVVFALLGQLAYNQFESWRRRKAIELHYPELSEHIAQTKWDLATFQEKFLGFWHQRSRGLQIESDLVLLTESIKQEQRRIQQVDEELREKGIDVELAETQTECSLDRNNKCTEDSRGHRSIDGNTKKDLNVGVIVR